MKQKKQKILYVFYSFVHFAVKIEFFMNQPIMLIRKQIMETYCVETYCVDFLKPDSYYKLMESGNIVFVN